MLSYKAEALILGRETVVGRVAGITIGIFQFYIVHIGLEGDSSTEHWFIGSHVNLGHLVLAWVKPSRCAAVYATSCAQCFLSCSVFICVFFAPSSRTVTRNKQKKNAVPHVQYSMCVTLSIVLRVRCDFCVAKLMDEVILHHSAVVQINFLCSMCCFLFFYFCFSFHWVKSIKSRGFSRISDAVILLWWTQSTLVLHLICSISNTKLHLFVPCNNRKGISYAADHCHICPLSWH